MGRLGVTTRAYLLLAVGAVAIVAGIYLATCSVGWTLFTAGILVALFALTLVDVPPVPPGTPPAGR